MPQRNQEKDSNSGVNLVEIWGSWIRVKKFQFLQANFKFFRQFYKRISSFAGKFSKILIFQVIKKIDLSSKKSPFTATSGQIILFLFKSHHFRTYFPVHDKI